MVIARDGIKFENMVRATDGIKFANMAMKPKYYNYNSLNRLGITMEKYMGENMFWYKHQCSQCIQATCWLKFFHVLCSS